MAGHAGLSAEASRRHSAEATKEGERCVSTSSQSDAAGRLMRALAAFQRAKGLLLTAHRQLKKWSPAEVNRFWARRGQQIELHVRAAAVEVVNAFEAFSAAGLVAEPGDRHLVSEAQRHLAEGR